MRTFSPELWHRSAKWNFTFFAFENSEREEKKSICMLVETRIHLTLTELRSLEFCYSPALHDIYTQSIRFREGGRQKKIWGMMGKKKQQKIAYYREGVWIFNKWGQKKCQWVVKLNSFTQTFFKLGVIFLEKNNCGSKSSKIIGYQSSAKSILKMSRSKWIY